MQYVLQQSETPGWWVLTDKENGVVINSKSTSSTTPNRSQCSKSAAYLHSNLQGLCVRWANGLFVTTPTKCFKRKNEANCKT